MEIINVVFLMSLLVLWIEIGIKIRELRIEIKNLKNAMEQYYSKMSYNVRKWS